MLALRQYIFISIFALFGTLPTSVYAAETASECLHTKPSLDDYLSYDDFLADAVRYKKQPDHCQIRPKEVFTPAPKSAYIITEPEDLNDALTRGKDLNHPVYEEKLRYDRTTSQSFPLRKMRSRELSAQQIEGALLDTAAIRKKELTISDEEMSKATVAEDNVDIANEIAERNYIDLRDASQSASIIVDSDGNAVNLTRTGFIQKWEINITYTPNLSQSEFNTKISGN